MVSNYVYHNITGADKQKSVIHNFDRAADTEKSPYLSGGLSPGHTGEVYRIRLD